jgi:hypothetical protein
MEKPFRELREQLLRAGIAPRHIRRYIAELEEHWSDLVTEGERTGRTRKDAESAAFARLGGVDNLAQAMMGRPEFRSCCARAPWIMFSLGPLLVLGLAYLILCCYLWLGWRIFLPGADTPFGSYNSGPVYSPSNVYFQAGRFCYFWAPVLVGWIIAFTAARQRLKSKWLVLGLALLAWMGGTAEIHASHATIPGGLGHISMNFFAFHGPAQQSFYALLMIFCISALPYLLWRVRRALA